MKAKLLAAMAVSATALTAASAAQAETELHFIRCGDGGLDRDLQVVEQFKAKNAGVDVKVESLPWSNCQEKALTLAAAGSPASLAYMGSRTLKQLADADLIIPASISEEKQKTYQNGVLKTVRANGEYWAYPRAFSTKALYVNCDLLSQAGLACEAPKNWDELYETAKTIKDKTGQAGIGLAGREYDNTTHQWLNYLYSNGGQVIDPATSEITLNSPQAVEALSLYAKLVEVAQHGPTAFERGQIKDLYNDGKVAMYIDGPWAKGQHKEGINEIVAPIPAGPSGESSTILITDSIAVFKGSGVEELATELAQALTSGDSQYSLDHPDGWGLTPIYKYEDLGYEDVYYLNNPFWDVFINSIPNGGPEPLLVDYKSMQAVLNSMIQGALLKDDTPENLVAIAAEELEEFK